MTGSALDFTFAAPGQWKLISTKTASNSATIDFTGLTNTYRTLAVDIANFLPVNNATNFWLRTSTNNGSSYDNGSNDYSYVNIGARATVTTTYVDSANTAPQIILNDTSGDPMSNAADAVRSALVYITKPNTSSYLAVKSQMTGKNNISNFTVSVSGGRRLSTTPVNALRFMVSSGNISTGTFTLYGLE